MAAVVKLVEKAADAVGSALSNVVDNALKDPIGTIAKVAAVATGQFELLPVISAVDVVANGGSLEDAAKAAAISYVAPQVGAQLGTALEYGTDPFSAQTTQLAAQSADMLSLPSSLAARAASSATASALGGGDIKQGMINTLANYGLRQGIDYTFDAAGNAINNNGDTLLSPTGELSPAVTTPISEQAQTDTNIIDNGDGTYTMPNPEGGSVTTDAAGNVISTTTEDGQVIPMRPVEEAAVTPVAEDQTTVEPIAPEATVTPIAEDQTITEAITPTETPTEVPGFKWDETIQTYVPEDAGTVDTSMSGYAIDPETGLPVAQEPSTDLNYGAVGNYLQNQLVNNFVKSLFGGKPTTATTSKTASGHPFTSGYVSYPDFSSTFNTLPQNYGFSDIPQQDLTAPSNLGDGLFDPTAGMVWAPQTKLGGLGPAGKYINQEADTYFINKEQELRNKAKQNLLNRGWLTEEDQAAMAQDPYFNYGEFDYSATPWMDSANIQQAAEGGLIDHNPEFYSEGGASLANRYVKGDGDGTSDSVPAMLASGEFVIPADVVSSLGNGDNDAGAGVLDEFMAAIRKHKRAAAPNELPPDSKGPLAYLADVMKKGK